MEVLSEKHGAAMNLSRSLESSERLFRGTSVLFVFSRIKRGPADPDARIRWRVTKREISFESQANMTIHLRKIQRLPSL